MKINSRGFGGQREHSTGFNHDAPPWGILSSYQKKGRRREKKKENGKYHNQTQQWQQATSIIIIISHHVYIAIMFFVAQSGALIRNGARYGRGGKKTVLWLLISPHKFFLVRLMAAIFHVISLLQTNWAIGFICEGILNYRLIINPPFMCCAYFSLSSCDLWFFNKLYRKLRRSPAFNSHFHTMFLQPPKQFPQCLPKNERNMSSQWSESRQQINVISRPSSELFRKSDREKSPPVGWQSRNV